MAVTKCVNRQTVLLNNSGHLSFVEAGFNCTGVGQTHIWKPWTDMRNRGRREREKQSERQEQHKATGGMSGLLAHSQFFQRTGPGEELCIMGYERLVAGSLVLCNLWTDLPPESDVKQTSDAKRVIFGHKTLF